MHKNLVTKISFKPSDNNFDSLEGFQEIISDVAYGTHYTIYGKFKGEFKDNDPNSNRFKITDAVLYLQNFSGQVTVGLVGIGNEINMAYYEDTQLPVYFIDLYVKPLYFSPFYPQTNTSKVDWKNEVLNNDETLDSQKISLADFDKLAIKNFTSKEDNAGELLLLENLKSDSETFSDHQGFLNLNYKIMFHINYFPSDYNLLSGENELLDDEQLKQSIFIDEKWFKRNGEIIQNIFSEFSLDIMTGVKRKSGRIETENFIDPKVCKNGLTSGC